VNLYCIFPTPLFTFAIVLTAFTTSKVSNLSLTVNVTPILTLTLTLTLAAADLAGSESWNGDPGNGDPVPFLVLTLFYNNPVSGATACNDLPIHVASAPSLIF